MSDTNEKQSPSDARKPNRPKSGNKGRLAARITLSALKWTILLGIVGGVTVGAAVTGYVSALVRDDEVRSRDTIIEAMQQNYETGFVYFQDGTVIGQLRTEEDRRLIQYKDIPKIVEDAVLATEDEDFYEHIGVDLSGLMRAVKQKVLNEDVQTGGSTITQQVARRVFLSLDQTDSRKFKEILLSLRLERFMTKEEILAAYLNKIPFGNGSNGYKVFGIKAAAKGIFNKELDELNIAQAAYLAGLPQQPSTFSAFTGKGEFDEEGFTLAKKRQELVLRHMVRVGKITQAQHDEALAFNLKASLAPSAQKAYATYPYLMLEAERKAAEVLLRQQNPELTEQDLRGSEYLEALEDAREMLLRGGYKIYTTIDKGVYEAMHRVSDNPESFSPDHEKKGVEQVGGILIDNDTGAILGMIEGRDFYKEQLNHATQMLRQPGSAMKPIAAYLPALETGKTQPADVIDDIPLILKDGSSGAHIPKNHDGKYHGFVTARDALNQSWNIPALKLFIDEVTIPAAWEFTKSLGITSIAESDYEARTGVIGGLKYGVSVEELTNAYAAIANQGMLSDAYFIQKITDANDKIVYEHQVKPKQVFSEQTAYLMTDMLRTVITNGTATRVKSRFEHEDKVPIVGKTGTTSDNYDLWFVGYTPDVTLGVWVGYGQPSAMTESNRAKYVWADVMNELVESKSDLFVTEAFPKPEGIVSKTVSRVSGDLPSEIVIQEKLTVTDIFNREHIPTKQDDVLSKTSVVIYDGKAYTPQPGTPADMLREMKVVKRPVPLSELMKQVEEALQRVKPENRRPLERYRPIDGYGDAPTEVDPRVENGMDPAPPPRVALTKVEKGVQVTFAASYNQDVAGYRVFRSVDGGPFHQMLDKTILTGESQLFVDEVGSEHVYAYYLVSVDIAGRVSPPSDIVYSGDPLPLEEFMEDDGAAETPLDPSEDPNVPHPTTPARPAVEARDLGLRLTWSPNPEDQQITAYHVYYAPAVAGPYKRIGSATGNEFDYLSLTAEGWYRITAENASHESTPSPPVEFSAGSEE
ncbi:transglycosylase domain-containing protein [Paenibacillus sp. TRM 82003]|nr:transglycosylase domain-containing protein [Paenibacillus sp. TRM 82003]